MVPGVKLITNASLEAKMTKYPSSGQDPYLDTNGVLRNRLGITDETELSRVEAAVSAVRSYELAHSPVRGNFDLAHIQAIHKVLFGDVYDWAGEIRTVDISKGETRFAHFQQIADYAPKITNRLMQDGFLQGLSPVQFSTQAGYYLGELNVLHPFREGNGRALREFINQLAQQAGYQIDWSGVDRTANIEASIAAFHGDSSQLSKLISDNLVDYEREAAIELAKQITGAQVQISKPETGKRYQGKLISETDRYIVQEQAGQPGHLVLHERRRLSPAPSDLIGQMAEVAYPHGQAGVVHVVENSVLSDKQINRAFER